VYPVPAPRIDLQIVWVFSTYTDRARLGELYACYQSDDEVVWLRTSNALKRISREQQRFYVPQFCN
jgi:hypothetical protein